MKGVVFDPVDQTLEFRNGSRKVMTAGGVMVSLLPEPIVITGQTLSFPDVTKGNVYAWTGSARLAFSTLGRREWCASWVSALAQEYSAKTVLADAPDGADFFFGRYRINRTTSPSHTWRGETVAVLPPEDQWLMTTGSALLEAQPSMARAMHIYIDDDPISATYRKLVLEAEQSVAAPPGGFTTLETAGDGANYASRLCCVNGANTANVASNGTAIYHIESVWYGPSNSSFSGSVLTQSSVARTLHPTEGGSNRASRTDPTNYASVYSVDIDGRFGRRG